MSKLIGPPQTASSETVEGLGERLGYEDLDDAHIAPPAPKVQHSVEQILKAVRITSLTRELDLSHAKGLTPSVLKSLCECLPKLRKLSLRDTELRHLPDCFEMLPDLKELDLSFNQIAFLPNSFGTLKSLQHLTIIGNKLEALPNCLGHIDNLRFLNVSNNQLQKLNPEIGSLKSLRVLRLSSNHLMEIPASLGNLSKLQLLQLSFNKLKYLPSELGNLTQLRVLNLSNNFIETLPESFANMRLLAYLNLSSNEIDQLPACFAAHEELQVLGLAELSQTQSNTHSRAMSTRVTNSRPVFFSQKTTEHAQPWTVHHTQTNLHISKTRHTTTTQATSVNQIPTEGQHKPVAKATLAATPQPETPGQHKVRRQPTHTQHARHTVEVAIDKTDHFLPPVIERTDVDVAPTPPKKKTLRLVKPSSEK